MSRRTRAPNLLSLLLVGFALYQELKKPPEERVWHGKLAVPYDFRLPTGERIRDAYWNPNDPRIFTETVFGVGWAVNLYSLRRRALELLEKWFPPAQPEG